MLARLAHAVRRRAAVLTLTLTALVTHGLVLVNDGQYVDGWPTYTQLVARQWDVLYTHLYRAGLPGTVLFYWVMDWAPGSTTKYRIVTMLAILVFAFCVYRLAGAAGRLAAWERLGIALIAITYPAFQTWVITPVELYVVFYALFVLAALLAVRAQDSEGPGHWARRVLALALFALSFNINSLLVLYAGVLLLLWLREPRRAVARFVVRHLDFVAVPVVYWVVKERLYPRYGDYAAYNPFSLAPASLTVYTGRFLIDAIFGQLNDALRMLLQQPALALILVAILYGALRRAADSATSSPPMDRAPSGLFWFGVVLLGLGIFPYVIVGVAPSLHGFSTRHALLVGLPMAVVLTGAIRLACRRDGARTTRCLAAVAILVVAFGLTLVDNYFAWQARWAKDRSVMAQLGRMSDARATAVFWIDDQFPIHGVNEYALYDWSSMFKTVWGGESRVGIGPQIPRDGWQDRITTWALYNLSELDKGGCQALLTIRRGAAASPEPWKLALHYLSVRFLRPAEMPRFLQGVTTVEVQPITAPEAVNCRR